MKNTLYFVLLSILTFSACKTEQLVDPICRDGNGNVYDTVTIGTQTWMKENLRATKYNDGTPIPLVTENDAWKALTTPAYCFMNNDTANAKPYGALYNWYVVNSSRNVCPVGWHVPTHNEWQTLVDYLGGYEVAGGKMKITGTEFWEEPNYGADNSSGFSAYPTPFRPDISGSIINDISSTHIWAATNYGHDMSIYLRLDARDAGTFISASYRNHGYSIRCIKN